MSPERDRSPQSRRRFLAVVGVAGIAGCSASTDQNGPTDDQSTATTNDRVSTSTGTGTAGKRGSTDDPTTTRPSVEDRYDLTVTHKGIDGDADWTTQTATPPDLETEVLVENLEIPWDVSFAPDGTLLLTERVGRVRAFDGDRLRTVAEPAEAIDAGSVPPGSEEMPWWVEGGEGGTLGIAVHPEYPDPPVVYVYHTTRIDGTRLNRVSAYDRAAENPGQTGTPIVDGIPADSVHNGGRITFGPENYLWITCGEAAESEKAQDPSTLHGTVLRVTPTGDPAPDNPDLGADADPRIYTYGHRNPQGIVFTPDGTPVVSEHGPGGRDELNRLVAGANYGWPDVRLREAYPDSSVHPPLTNTGGDTWAPTGATFYTGDGLAGLHNRLLIGGLWSQQVTVATLTPPEGTLPPVADGTRFDGEYTDDAYTVTTHTVLKDELGRIRRVAQGPDGDLYVLTSNRDGRAQDPFPRERDDVLVRLTTSE